MNDNEQELDLLHRIFSSYLEDCVSSDEEEMQKTEELYENIYSFLKDKR